MPLVILTGYPSSGKTTRCKEIKKYLEEVKGKSVQIVSEDDVLAELNYEKNSTVFDSRRQKIIRGNLKSKSIRLMGSDVVILDASNNIKGFRYELYCAAKCHKTTQVVVECAISTENAWKNNELRVETEKYNREAFDALIALHEPVDSSNRWDSPLVTIQIHDVLPGDEIYSLLYERIAPKPNQSTQKMPLCSSSYLSDLDKVTKEVINDILSLKNDGISGRNIKLSNIDAELEILDDRLNLRKLSNLKHQFLSYCKLNPSKSIDYNVAKLFVQFINTSRE